jgi:hypothetical protein
MLQSETFDQASCIDACRYALTLHQDKLDKLDEQYEERFGDTVKLTTRKLMDLVDAKW